MLAPSMVGRADERSELVGLARVASGTIAAAQTVVITGEAGVGKSMLVSAGARRLRPLSEVSPVGHCAVARSSPVRLVAAVLRGPVGPTVAT